MSEDANLREQAIRQLKKKREFTAHLGAFVAVNGLLIVTWLMTGRGFFWPVFPLFGWGIGLFFHWWEVYRGEPTEAEIAREMGRIKRSS